MIFSETHTAESVMLEGIDQDDRAIFITITQGAVVIETTGSVAMTRSEYQDLQRRVEHIMRTQPWVEGV